MLRAGRIALAPARKIWIAQKAFIEAIRTEPVLMACKSFPELHEHCDANTLGCQEELLDVYDLKNALPILNAAQDEVNLWLVANSIPCQPHWDSTDMNVESHSAGFKVKYGRVPNWDTEAALCDEFWFDEIY